MRRKLVGRPPLGKALSLTRPLSWRSRYQGLAVHKAKARTGRPGFAFGMQCFGRLRHFLERAVDAFLEWLDRVGGNPLRQRREFLGLRAQDVEFKSYDAAHEMVPAMRDDVRAWLKKYAE